MAWELELSELKSMILSLRIPDIQTLLTAVGRSYTGRKQDLQYRALDILKNPSPDINIEIYKQKIKELFQIAQSSQRSSVKQTQIQMQHTLPDNRNHYQLRNNMNVYSHQVQQSRTGIAAPNTMGYSGNMENINANNYGQSIYNSQSNPQTIYLAPSNLCNFSNSAQILTNPTVVPANITFRKLPFYKVKYEVLKPILLKPNCRLTLPPNIRTSATHEFHVSFLLSCDMASDLAMNRDIIKNDYSIQAQVRITAIDSNNVTNSSLIECDDFLPLGLVIRINNRQCTTLPPCSPSSRQGVESRRIPRPINITTLIKMSPIASNVLVINWASEINKSFVVTLNLVEKLTSEFLLNKLKEKPTISVDITKFIIQEQYKRVIDDDNDDCENASADDDDIATTIVRVSLVCPLAKFRMMYPAKGKNCSHLQCFDGSAYISLNEKKPMWMCPVCSRPLYYDDLQLDQYFMNVLCNEQLPEDCQEVQLLVDGTWKSYDEEKSADKNNKNNESPASSPTQAISVGNSTELDDSNLKDTVLTESAGDVSNAAEPVVDLTYEDEEIPVSVSEMSTPVTTDETTNTTLASKTTVLDHDQMQKESNTAKAAPLTVIAKTTASSIITTSASFASSMISNNSCYNSPNIISLDSPSPPTFSSSPQSAAIASLNIDHA